MGGKVDLYSGSPRYLLSSMSAYGHSSIFCTHFHNEAREGNCCNIRKIYAVQREVMIGLKLNDFECNRIRSLVLQTKAEIGGMNFKASSRGRGERAQGEKRAVRLVRHWIPIQVCLVQYWSEDGIFPIGNQGYFQNKSLWMTFLYDGEITLHRLHRPIYSLIIEYLMISTERDGICHDQVHSYHA